MGHTFGVRVQKVQKVQKVQRVADCPSGNAYKVSVTDLPFCIIRYDRILLTGSLRSPPYPAAPDFPRKRGQNKALKSSPFISSSQHNGAL